MSILLERYYEVEAAQKAFSERRQQLIENFFASKTEKIALPGDRRIYWHEPTLRVDLHTEEVSLEFPQTPRIINGRSLKDEPAGRKFVVLAAKKTGKKVRLTHYALFNPRTRMIAHVAF